MATAFARRALLACLFCASCCGGAAAEVRRALRASRGALAALSTAEQWAKKQKEIEDRSDKDYFTDAAPTLKSLAAAVRNATGEAAAAVAAVEGAVRSSGDDEQRALMTAALEDAKKLLKALTEANTKAQEMEKIAQHFDYEGEDELIDVKLGKVISFLKEATEAAGGAERTIQAALTKASDVGGLQEESTDGSILPTQTQQETASSGNGKEGTEPADTPQLSDRPQDSVTHGSPDTRDNELCKPAPTLSAEARERNILSMFLKEEHNTDGAHGGAIATCTAAPLLLLLTAVAYAAV